MGWAGPHAWHHLPSAPEGLSGPDSDCGLPPSQLTWLHPPWLGLTVTSAPLLISFLATDLVGRGPSLNPTGGAED